MYLIIITVDISYNCCLDNAPAQPLEGFWFSFTLFLIMHCVFVFFMIGNI